MAREAIIRHRPPLLELSLDGETPLPQDTRVKLEKLLTYTHLHANFGAKAYQRAGGGRESHTGELRRLYEYDRYGRFICQQGYLPRMQSLLGAWGYDVCVVTVPSNKVRENRFTEDWDRVVHQFQFRPAQDKCLVALASHDCGIVDAVPAFGKMYLMWMLACLYPKAKIDIVTKRKDVVQSIVRLGGRYVANVGQVGGGKRRQERVTVYTADSLHHSDFDADILLADEVHELVTDRYAALLGRYAYTRMYGFTASKETRFDNAHERLEALFGPTIFKLTHPEAVDLGLVSPIVVQWLNVTMNNPIQNTVDTVARKRNGVWRNPVRNKVIADAVRAFVEADMQILILVDTVDHALHLRQFLPDFALCYSEQALDKPGKRQTYEASGMMSPDEPVMTSVRRQELRQAFERRDLMRVIATGVWSVGVSFDSLQVLVRAGGGRSETASIQLPGRVGRICAETGKPCGVLVDCMDMFDPGMKEQAYARRRDYAAQGWLQYNADGTVWRSRRRGGKAI